MEPRTRSSFLSELLSDTTAAPLTMLRLSTPVIVGPHANKLIRFRGNQLTYLNSCDEPSTRFTDLSRTYFADHQEGDLYIVFDVTSGRITKQFTIEPARAARIVEIA